MPVTYRIDTASGIIRTQCIGFVTVEDVVQHFQDLVSDPGCPRELDVLLDLSEMTSAPTTAKLRIAAEAARGVGDRVRFGAVAILVSTDALHGSSMIFEVLAARSFQITRIFRDRAEAEAFLARQRSSRG